MKRLQNELTSLVNRGIDRHLRLAVTGLSRSGQNGVHHGFRQSIASCAQRRPHAAVFAGA
ncbi:Predicted ATPase [Serratia odorifera]|uniref:Predicted ATPase n=1 Tax=Serratia odorifera TaxID=618 RepID=A0A447KY44_SEROD|nr:Predicted ATPase [Serratia odorifera]